MFGFLAKRSLIAVMTLLGIMTLVFVLIRVIPGDPASIYAASRSDTVQRGMDQEAAREEFRTRHGLDRPLMAQWGTWMSALLRFPPDFGDEFTSQRAIGPELASRLKVSIPLNGAALFLSFALAIPLGILSAVRRHQRTDRLITLALYALYSMPVFWLGTTLIMLLCHQGFLNLFPVLGLYSDDFESLSWSQKVLDIAHHAILPLMCLTYGNLAYIARIMRGSLIDALRADFCRTAAAKGLSKKTIVWRHALRNALIPVITLFGSAIPFLVGGSILVETLFDLPGLGQYAWKGLVERDYNIVMATTVLAAIATLVGFLLSDVAYALVDPRLDLDR